MRPLLRPLLVAGVTAAAVLGFVATGILRSWDWKISDTLAVGHPPPSDIVIVAIDNESIQALGRWPWRRSVHADIIRELQSTGAVAIGYDVNFPEAATEEEDAALEAALFAASGRVVLPFEATLRLGQRPPRVDSLLSPLSRFAKNVRLGLANTPPDADGVLRRVPSSVVTENGERQPAFFAAIAAVAGFRPLPAEGDLLIDFAGPPQSIRTLPAADLIAHKIPRATLAGKIVLVGATAPDLHDQVLTPTAKRELMSGVEVQANAVASSRYGGWRPASPISAALAIILLAFLGAFPPLRLRRVRSALLLQVGALVGYLLLAFFLAETRRLISIFYPALALLISSAVATLLRLAREKLEKSQLRATLSRYVSHQVVEFLLRHPERLTLGGEKREMTVLFSDLRGFTSLSEKLKPEQLVAVLNTYLSEMTTLVFADRGVLDKYMGDALMAFWNAPLDDADHAENAVRAAIAMRQRLREMNATGSFPAGVELRLGVGVNSGPMVVGNMGGRERFDYTVMGDAVNLGSRLEGLNKEYGTEIIVSETTAAKLSNGILLRPLDLVAVKGKKEPVEIFEVIGLRDEAAPEAIQFVADFAAARELYKERKFADSEAAFTVLVQKFPADQASKNYLERSRTFRSTPPPADWNGVWVMTKK